MASVVECVGVSSFNSLRGVYMDADAFVVGDVFQINEKHVGKGWVGALVTATEIKSWGIQGFVVHVVGHDKQRQAFIRLDWSEIDYVGKAQIIQANKTEGTGREDQG